MFELLRYPSFVEADGNDNDDGNGNDDGNDNDDEWMTMMMSEWLILFFAA